MRKALPWILVAVAVVIIGVLLSSCTPNTDGGSDTSSSTSGKPACIEFYTPT